MVRLKLVCLFTIVLAPLVQSLRAGVPEPAVVLYGEVIVNQQVPTAPLDLIARSTNAIGAPDPVAEYVLEDAIAGFDHYVLRIRMEAAVGGPRSPNAAVQGESATIFLVQGGVEYAAVDAAGQPIELQLTAAGSRSSKTSSS